MKMGAKAFTWLGIVCLTAGTGFLLYYTWFRLSAEAVQGRVTHVGSEVRDKSDIDRQRREGVTHAHIDHDTTLITVEYSVGDQPHTAEFGIGEQKMEVGDPVDLFYLEGQPGNPKMGGFRWLFLGPLALTVMGTVFYLTGRFVSVLV